MEQIWCLAFLYAIVFVFVNGHVVNNINNNDDINNIDTSNSSNAASESNNMYNSTEAEDFDGNSTDITNTTVATTEMPEENRFFRLRERFHYRNRRYRLRRIREQILQSLGWTEPPQIPESVRRRKLQLNNSYPLLPFEPEVREDRRCFSASCVLPRQIDRNLWEDTDLIGFRVFTNILPGQALTGTTLESATLNVFLTHREGFTCHGEVVPISRTGSRFLVSVYQFIRPLRIQRSRQRVMNRKRLIDARMVTTRGDTWVTFDVRRAVLEWVSGVRNNFGFEITVRDEDETECNAVEMFIGADCQSPPETGCREDNSEFNRLPWRGDGGSASESNYPYLELVSRQQRPPQGSRMRIRRSSRDSSSRHDLRPASSRATWSDDDRASLSRALFSQNGNARRTISRTASSRTSPFRIDVTAGELPSDRESTIGFCQGREVRIDTYSTGYVIAPRYYTTLVCSGTCATTYNGMLQIAASRCRPVEERRVVGLYFDNNNNILIGELPYTQVLQCGC